MHHLSPLTVYFILQLDSIRDALCLSLIIPAAIFGGLRCLALFAHETCDSKDEKSESKQRVEKCWQWNRIAALVAAGLIIYGIVPSTRTAAGMIIAPAVVNSNAVQSDIPELYVLGVERIKAALKGEKETVK